MIKFETLQMPAASMGELNPMPDIKNISYIHAGYELTEKIKEEEQTYIGKGMINTLLPYMIQDGYDRDKKMRSFKAAVLENDYIRAVFLPELGGRLWSLFDKELNRELLYVNPVYQPGNLGLRNAWFSGGVEFNVGIKGHNPLTCSPLWCSVDTTSDGEVLRLYEYERIRGVAYSINAYLPEDSKALYLKMRIENKTSETKNMYWWSNIAVPETKETRVIVPTDESFLCFYNADHYVLDKATIPQYEDIDVTYPCNIPSSRDFFYKIPKEEHKWIASAESDGVGLLQCSTRELIGRKLFVWGQAQGGKTWNEWLSEEGSAYIEIQAGLAHTQLEHIPMEGNSVWEWTEAYTALNCDEKILHGDYSRAVEEVKAYMYSRIGNPDEMKFPSDSDVLESKIIYKGSGWGKIEELIREEKISDNLVFDEVDDEETHQWLNLIKNNKFEAMNVSDTPKSYVTGDFWLEKLKALKEQNWYSLLHIGVILYAKEDLEGAKNAFEKSLEMEKSSWAYRNLAMLYKNEFNEKEKAREFILKAFELNENCISLVKEVAMILTSDGGVLLWLGIYEKLSKELKETGRIRLYKAIALLHINKLKEASEIINERFIMSDIKEGELSVSYLWFELYRRLYAEEQGIPYAEMDADLIAAADLKYPLPKSLDFRMHL